MLREREFRGMFPVGAPSELIFLPSCGLIVVFVPVCSSPWIDVTVQHGYAAQAEGQKGPD